VLCCIVLFSSVSHDNLCVIKIAENGAYREGVTKSIRSTSDMACLLFRRGETAGDGTLVPISSLILHVELTLFPRVATIAYTRLRTLENWHQSNCLRFIARPIRISIKPARLQPSHHVPSEHCKVFYTLY